MKVVTTVRRPAARGSEPPPPRPTTLLDPMIVSALLEPADAKVSHDVPSIAWAKAVRVSDEIAHIFAW